MSLLPDWALLQPAAPDTERQALTRETHVLRCSALRFVRLALGLCLENLRRAALSLKRSVR